MQALDFEAIGTWWRIETEHALGDEVQRALQERVALFDKTYSRFRNDSLVAAMAKSAGQYDFPNDVLPLIDFYRKLYELSDGLVTPLVGGLLEAIGYNVDYTLRPQSALPSVPKWDEVMQWQGSRATTRMPMTLDFGAAGKGYLVDLLAEICEQYGVGPYIIDASGDILNRSTRVERVGLEHPQDPTKVIGVWELMHGRALGASAVNRRTWAEGLHHIVNPNEQSPEKTIAATWVVAETTMMADGLATALFLCEPATLQKAFHFDYVRIRQDGTIERSDGFQGELFI